MHIPEFGNLFSLLIFISKVENVIHLQWDFSSLDLFLPCYFVLFILLFRGFFFSLSFLAFSLPIPFAILRLCFNLD